MNSNKLITWLRDKSIETGIMDILNYESTNMWWFCEFRLYQSLIKNMESNSSNKLGNLTYQHYVKYYQILKAILRCVIGRALFSSGTINEGNKYKILLISYTNYWSSYPSPKTLETSGSQKTDFMMGGLIKVLENRNCNLIALDQDVNYFVDINTLIKKRISEGNIWKPVEYYLTQDCITYALKLTKEYQSKWYTLKKSQKFINSWKHDENKFKNILVHSMDDFVDYNLFPSILYLQIINNVINIESPDVAVLSCSYCDLGRAAIVTSNIKNIPVLELQHGVIHPNHNAYMYRKGDMPRKDNIIPDGIAVYGRYHYKLLTQKSIYNPKKVFVTGQPRYDALYHSDIVYSKECFLNRYGISSDSKIILWTTQCHGLRYEENVKSLESILGAMQKLSNVILIIKQHPREGRIYKKMIKKYLNEYGIPAIMPPINSDTYEQLFICDLMITKNSTTAMEAIALNKSVIILNLSGEQDVVNYVEEGVALGVYNEADLKPAIETLLSDDSILAKNRANYIEDYLYKIDGKATERVVNVIFDLIHGIYLKNKF